MPTPSSNEPVVANLSSHISCPPDDDRSDWRGAEMNNINEGVIATAPEVHQQPTPPPSDSHIASSAEARIANTHGKRMDIDEEATAPDMLSPMSTDGEKQEEHELPTLASRDLSSPSLGYDFSNIRVRFFPIRPESAKSYANQCDS